MKLYWYSCMRFSVDAHAIGRHLTGNEVYIRNLLQGFAGLDQTSEFIAYLSQSLNGAEAAVPERFTRRYVSANCLKRLGWTSHDVCPRIVLTCCTFNTLLRSPAPPQLW